MSYINKESLIKSMRANNPQFTVGLSDRQLYEYARKHLNPEEITGIAGSEFLSWDETPTIQKQNELQKSSQSKSPDVSQHPKTWWDSLSNANAMGWLGDATDWNFAKYSAMQGSTDVAWAAATGKSGYTLKDEDGNIISPEEYSENLNFAQEALAWVAGQLNPVDAAIWAATLGTGKYVQGSAKIASIFGKGSVTKGEMGYLRDKMANSSVKTIQKLAKTDNAWGSYVANTLAQMPSTALSIGAFSAGTGTIHSAHKQRMSKVDDNGIGIGEIDLLKTLSDGAYHGLEGTILGAVTAGVGGAISGPLAKGAAKFEGTNVVWKNKVASMMRHPLTTQIPAVGVEGAIFGLSPYLVEGLPKNEDGTVNYNAVNRQWAQATSALVLLKLGFGGINKLAKNLKDEVDFEQKKLSNDEAPTDAGNIANNSIKNIASRLKNQGFDDVTIKELTKDFNTEVSDVIQVDIDAFGGKKKVLEAWELAKKHLEKVPEGKDPLDVLTDAEISESMAGVTASKIMQEIYAERLVSTEAFDTYFDGIPKEKWLKENPGANWAEVRDTEGNYFKKSTQSILNRLQKDSVKMNKNIVEPKAEIVKERESVLKEIEAQKKTIEGLSKDKQLEAEKLIVDIEKAPEATREKLQEIIDRKTPEQRVSELKDELISLVPKNVKLAEWKKEIAAREVLGKPEETIASLEQLVTQRKKAGEVRTELEKEVDALDLKTKILDIKTEAGRERLTSDGKTVDTLIKESKLSDRNKKMAMIGFEKFLKPRNFAAGKYKQALEFFDYLQKNGYEINQANDSIFTNFLKSKKLITASEQKPYQDIIAAFYGGKAGGAKQKAFSDLYMDKDIVATTVRVPTVGAKRATVSQAEQVKLKDTLSKFKDTVVNTKPEVATSGIELQYYFGRRGTDIFEHLKAKDLNTKTGEITLSSAKKVKGVRIEQTFPLKEMLPELYNKLVKIKKGKADTDLLLVNKSGKKININKFINEVFKQGDIDATLFGGKTKFSMADFRKTLETDAADFGLEVFARDLTGRGKTVQETYVTKEFITQFKDFASKRLGKVEPVEKIKGDISGTPEQVIKFWEDSVASIKKSIKIAKSAGERENLQSQLKGASFQLSAARKALSQITEKMVGAKGKVYKPATIAEIKRAEKLYKNYPEVKLKLNEKKLYEKGKEITADDVFETYLAGEVKVKQGAPVEAALHGLQHPILKLLRSIEQANPKKNLGKSAAGLVREAYNRARKHKRFQHWRKEYIKQGLKSKEATERALEETNAEILGEFFAGKAIDKPLYQKIKDWLKRAYTTLKSTFKEVDKLTEDELIARLASKIAKRNLKEIPVMAFDNVRGQKMEFMTAKKGDPDEIRKIVNKTFKEFIKEAKSIDEKNPSEVKDFKQDIAIRAKIKHPSEFDFRTSSEKDLMDFYSKLQEVDIAKHKRDKDIIDLLKDLDDVKDNRIKANITEAKEIAWLKEEGVESGKLVDAPTDIRKEWVSIVSERAHDAKSFYDNINDFNLLMDSGDGKKLNQKTNNTLLRAFSLNVLSAIHSAKSMGMNALSRWFTQHSVTEQRHTGPWVKFIDFRSKEILGKSYNKYEPIILLAEARDSDGAFYRINDASLNKSKKKVAKEFISKGFIVEKKVDKKTNIEKWYNRGIKWDPKTKKGTKEGQFLYEQKELIDKLPKELEDIATITFNEAKAEQIIKENNLKWLNQSKYGYYMPKRMTTQFGDHYNPGSPQVANAIKKLGREKAHDRAVKKYGDKFTKAKKIEKAKMMLEFIDTAINEAKIELNQVSTFGHKKFNLVNLVNRNRIPLQETFTTLEGKKIEVWETGYENAMFPYASGWAKFLTNMELAPWAVGLKEYSGTNVTKAIDEFASKNFRGQAGNDIRKHFTRAIERRIGTYSEGGVNSYFHKGAREYTATLMRLQLGVGGLSAPKNVTIQAVQLVHSFAFNDVVQKFLQALSKRERMKTEEIGAGSIVGIAGYKPKLKTLKRGTEKIFRWGGMPITESFVKTWGRLLGEVDGRLAVDHIRTLPKESRQYKESYERLTEFYKLNEKQIEAVERHGLDPDVSNLSPTDAKLVLREINNIDNQMGVVGSMKTAGSTSDAMMPELFNKKWIKPFLMFKRIATSTTNNTSEMMALNLKHRHYGRIAMYVGGTYISGMARIGMLKMFLGQTLPDENSEGWKSLFTHLWQGEFLGILSELFSPYNRNLSMQSWFSLDNNAFMQASVLTHLYKTGELAHTLLGEKAGLYDTKMTSGQAFKQWAQGTSATVSNWIKVKERTANQYNRDYLAVRKWIADYENKHQFLSDPTFDANESGKYFKMVKTMFNLKKENEGWKDVNEAFILAFLGKASDHIHNGRDWKQAFKEAESNMKAKINTLSPLKFSLDKKKGMLITDMEAFFSTLDKDQQKTAVKIYAQYEKKVKEFNKQFPHYLRTQNMSEFSKYFKFELKPQMRRALDKYLKRQKLK